MNNKQNGLHIKMIGCRLRGVVACSMVWLHFERYMVAWKEIRLDVQRSGYMQEGVVDCKEVWLKINRYGCIPWTSGCMVARKEAWLVVKRGVVTSTEAWLLVKRHGYQ